LEPQQNNGMDVYHRFPQYSGSITVWLFNIAMENGPL
jgi:hypothetical protein